MRVLQFAKRSVVTVALACVTLAGCSGDSSPDAPFNPAGTSADLEAMNSTFASPTFASFSTFSLMFDQALGGSPIVSGSAAAFDIRGRSTADMRAAAVRSAQRLSALMQKPSAEGLSASPSLRSGQAIAASISSTVAGKTFVYDVGTGGYVASDLPLLASNTVRFMLYAVDPVTFAPVEPLVETGHVDLIDVSAGSTQAARVLVVSGSTTYIDYTVSATSTSTSGRVSVIGYITDGTNQANITLKSTLTYTAGLTLTYSLDLPQRDVSIDLTLNVSDITGSSGTIDVSLVMQGPNGTVSMSGEFTETTGTLTIRVNGATFATITTNGTITTITRTDGTPLAPDEEQALGGIFEISSSAFIAFDQMLAPIGAFFG